MTSLRFADMQFNHVFDGKRMIHSGFQTVVGVKGRDRTPYEHFRQARSDGAGLTASYWPHARHQLSASQSPPRTVHLLPLHIFVGVPLAMTTRHRSLS